MRHHLNSRATTSDSPQAPLVGLDGQLRGDEATATSMQWRRVAQFSDVQAWCRRQIDRIRQRGTSHGTSVDDELFAYQQAAKLVEEVGELHAELLARSRAQRASKRQAGSFEQLSAELADVLICTFIMAEVLSIDVGEALAHKMSVVDTRDQP